MNLSGKLPDEGNGLHSIATLLVDEPAVVRLAIVEYDVVKLTTDVATGGRTATLRVVSIEPVVDRDEVLRVRALLARERTRRNDRAPLPGQLQLFDEGPGPEDPPEPSAMDRIDPGP